MAKFIVYYNPNLPWQGSFILTDCQENILDLRDCSLRMHVREKLNADKILAIASTENAKIIAEKEEVIIELTAVDTLNMANAAYKCITDVEVTFPDGRVIPEVFSLEFKINKSATRDY